MPPRSSVDKRPEIVVEDVSKSFELGGDVLHVLRNVHFEAKAGELVMIVGPSGSGKTTLLSAIAGTLSTDSGKIRLFDCCLEEKTPSEITAFRKRNIGFIFQQFHLIPSLSCGVNAAIPLLLNGWDYAKALEAARLALDEVGLASKFDALPRNLSGGQQQRVAIARALIHKPALVICDEPTSALDAESGSKIMDLIASHVKNADRVVIVVTHDSRIFKYADRMVKMDDGKITHISGQSYAS
jgi:putative ABC transport system ATP-binding protein